MALGGIRVSTGGESHGPAEVCIVAGIPAGVPIVAADIDRDLARRQRGYGRGGRMRVEADRVRILSGVRLGRSLGSPITLLVENADHANWREVMAPEARLGPPPEAVTVPRPGHADLTGAAKTGTGDVRDVLERSSARETVGRVAAGAIAKSLLREVGVTVQGRVIALGEVRSTLEADPTEPLSVPWAEAEDSEFGCDDRSIEAAMRSAVDAAREQGESLGGVFEVWAWGLCPGVGGYATPEERLDGRLMGALGSIPAIKGVEVGAGFAVARSRGSAAHDPIVLGGRGPEGHDWVTRSSNRAGGLEGGMTNGMPVIARAAMKPIPTLTRPLPSVDIATLEAALAHRERSDTEAIAAARVVGEAVVACVLASAYMEKFGGDSVGQFRHSHETYLKELVVRGLWRE